MIVTVVRSSNNMQTVYIGKVSQAQAKQDKVNNNCGQVKKYNVTKM